MPGTHSPISRPLFTYKGMVLTSGGAKNLAKGQFTIIDKAKAGVNGAVVVSSFAGKPKSTVYEMRVGKAKVPASRSNFDSKPYSSHLFTIDDVKEVTANFPKVTEQKFDELVIGYDGINADTAIDLEEGMTVPLDIIFCGEPVSYLSGGQEDYVVKIHFGKETGETNQEVVRRAVANLKTQMLPGSVPITELADISVVDSTNPELGGTSYTISSLTVVDEGDSNALARVQAQYPSYDVVLKERMGLTSVYTILHPTASSLSNYNNIINAAYIKGCEDCSAGYSELTGGVVYSVSLEDDGTDQTALVDDLPGFVTGSVLRHGVKNGRGLYTVVLDNALTDAEITTYVTTAGVKTTAELKLLGNVEDVCFDDQSVTIAWVSDETCYAQVDQYSIQLKDNDCGESRLAELQTYYPNLVIEEGLATGNSSQTITLTGTSGTANVNVGGTNYLATFATDLTTTASNFVTAHAATILADSGVTVTANAGVLTFTGPTDVFPVSIANATGNLAGTVSAIDYVVAPSVGGCQRVYSTTVVTNVVCDECDPMYLEQFISEAPSDFDFTSWELVEPAPNENALMGIRIVGKPFTIVPTEATRDMIPFIESSVRIKVAGGYVNEENISFEPINREIFSVKRLSRAQDRDALGGHLMQWESASQAYFDGTRRHTDLFAKQVFGQESVLDFQKQYCSIRLVIQDSKYSQSAGGRSDIGISYDIFAELGYEGDLVNYINSLAARAGLEAIAPTINRS